MKTLSVEINDILKVDGLDLRAIDGKGGRILAERKREGDGASPIGEWPLRRAYYRLDRLDKPVTRLPLVGLTPDMGWCDAPDDPAYNRPVTLPYPASHERLWREDHAYDVIVELGYNDRPPIPGRGSAIFMHVAQPDFRKTEGCIALELADLLTVLRLVDTNDVLHIKG